MTNAEVKWLAPRIPASELASIREDAQTGAEYWAAYLVERGLGNTRWARNAIIAVQFVTVELGLIAAGGLDLLKRSPV